MPKEPVHLEVDVGDRAALAEHDTSNRCDRHKWLVAICHHPRSLRTRATKQRNRDRILLTYSALALIVPIESCYTDGYRIDGILEAWGRFCLATPLISRGGR